MIICRMTLRYTYINDMNNPERLNSNEAPAVLMRVDACKEMALGHLKRCVSLAIKLREKGVPVVFLTAGDGFSETLLQGLGFRYEILGSDINSANDCNSAISTAEEYNAKIIVIDSYEIDDVYRSRLMSCGYFVVSIDDNAERNLSSHVITNGNLKAEHLNYPAVDGVSKCAGIEYLILGHEFWNPEAISDTESVHNVLITMGGIDHYDLTSKILSILDGMDSDFDITVIIGPYYDNEKSICRQVSAMNKKVELVTSPTSLYPYMKRCAMAFSAGGQTLYELSVLGRPTIGITLWENQAGNVNELSKMGAIYGIVYSASEEFDAMLSEKASRLIHDMSERKRISRIASSIVDGQGAERTYNAILESYREWVSLRKYKEIT